MKTRDRILRDAAQLFALKGLHDTKVDEIIKAAEVASGAFFHHCKGREDLKRSFQSSDRLKVATIR